MTVIQTSDLDELRESVQHEIESLVQLRTLLLEQHNHNFKWLNASLLAMNGGALVAILNSGKLQANIFPATFFFLAGIVLSLFIGVAAQKISVKSLGPYQRMIGYWISVKSDGKRLPELEADLNEEAIAANKYAWVVPAIGWLSGISFLAGCLLLFASIDSGKMEEVNQNVESAFISGNNYSQPNNDRN